jgi:hypothetical protein
MVVVATGLVTEARSKRVAGVTPRSKSPPFGRLRAGSCRKERDGGAPSVFVSYLKPPNAFRATRRLARVTAMEAAGKARAEIASCRTEKAWEKILS